MRVPPPREIRTTFGRLGWVAAAAVEKLNFKTKDGDELKSVRATLPIPPFAELLSFCFAGRRCRARHQKWD
jgi:hypothetical protein